MYVVDKEVNEACTFTPSVVHTVKEYTATFGFPGGDTTFQTVYYYGFSEIS